MWRRVLSRGMWGIAGLLLVAQAGWAGRFAQVIQVGERFRNNGEIITSPVDLSNRGFTITATTVSLAFDRVFDDVINFQLIAPDGTTFNQLLSGSSFYLLTPGNFNGTLAKGIWHAAGQYIQTVGDDPTWNWWELIFSYNPEVQIIAPGPNQYLRGDVLVSVKTIGTQNLTIELEDVNTGQVFTLDALTNPYDPSGTVDWTHSKVYDTRVIPDGRYILRAIAVDNENIQVVATVNVTIDNTPPTVGPVSPLDGATVTGNVLFSTNASDNLALESVYLSVDGDVPVPMNFNTTTGKYEAAINTANYADGAHTITFTAEDSTENVATQSITVIFDQTPPTASVLTPADGDYVSGTTTFHVQALDNLAVDRVELTFGGNLASLGTVTALYDAASGTYTYTINSALFADGPATVQATVYDKAGLSATSAVVNFWVDNTDPTLQVLAPQDGQTYTGDLLVQVDATDANGVASVNLRIDGGAPIALTNTAGSTYEVTVTTSTYTDGPHTLELTVTDNAGRSVSSSLTVQFDNTAPTVAVVAPTAGVYLSGTTVIQVQATDNIAVDRVDLIFGGVLSGLGTQQATYNASTGYYEFPVDLSVFADGAASVEAVAYDASGLSSSSGVVDFFVDNAAPAVQFLSPIGGSVVTGDVALRVLAYDDAGIQQVLYAVDGGSFFPMNPVAGDTFEIVLSTALFEEGTHTLTVRAVSTTGASSEASLDLVFDNTAPVVSVSAPDGGAFVKGLFTFQATGTDNIQIDRVQFTFGGVLSSLGTVEAAYNAAADVFEFPVDTRAYGDGEGTVTAQIVDAAGLTSSQTVTFTVDNTAPTAQITIEDASGNVVDTIVPNTDYTVRVITSEDLAAVPYLAFLPEGFDTVILDVQQVAANEYTALLRVDGSTGDVRARFLFRGQDAAGNVGTTITSGAWFAINVVEPVLVHQPVNLAVVGQDLTLTITAGASRNVEAYLYYKGHYEDNYRVKPFSATNPMTVTIPKEEVGLQGLDYYIEVINEEGTTVRDGDPANPHYVKVVAWVGNGEVYEDDHFRVEVPAGALNGSARVGLSMPFTKPQPSGDDPFTGYFIEVIGPATLARPVSLTLKYSEADVEGMNEDMLRAVDLRGEIVGEAQPNAAANEVTVKLSGSLADTTVLLFVERYVALDTLALLPRANVFVAPSPVRNVRYATITFFLNPTPDKPLPDQVTVEVYDIAGDPVAQWVLENVQAGLNQVRWDVSRVPRGVYIFRVKAGDEQVVKRVAVVK